MKRAIAVVLTSFLVSASLVAAPLTLAEKGKTAYVIYHDPAAPGSVKTAAQELQRLVRASTGVAIPTSDAPAERMVCLGDCAAARQAGLSVEGLEEDAFRLATRGECLYVLGKDSPRNTVGWGGNENRGTLYGTYAFLERVMGVRWLTPGEDGEDVPRLETVSVPALDVTEPPTFRSRVISGRSGSHTDWFSRHGCGGWRVQHGHAWDAYPSRAVLRGHPEYLAMRGRKRMAVPADDKAPFQPKFCTTNPGLVQAFADGVIDWFEKNPAQRFASISPSDGGGWCECPECSKLTVNGPSEAWGDYGCWGHSVTPLILKFYNDVARIVAAKCPDRVVCGYVYYDFTFPPDPAPRMEPNVALMLAPLQHYGLTRYKPEYRAEFERLCEVWGKASSHVGYYGASTWMRVGIGAPLGPSLPLLKHTFATLKKNGFKSVYYYALPWDSCGVHNYLAAKLMWNAEADVDALLSEWLDRAYGPGAPAMARLYRLLDQEMEAAKKETPRIRADYEMTSELAMKVYVKNFWTIESLYREAQAAAVTDAQRARLAVFGDNLVILHHVLNEAGVLEGAERSMFQRTAEEYGAFLKAKKASHAVRTMQMAGEQGGITGIMATQSRAKAAGRTLNIPRLPQGTPPPRIDGDLSDAAWRAASSAEQYLAVADKFTVIGGQQPTKRETRALLTYDDQNLYVSFRCADEQVDAIERESDDTGIYEDDCVEFFFSCGAEDPTWHWHLTVNPRNARWDALTTNRTVMDTAANLEWESAAGQGEGYWAVEMRIPFKAVKPPTAAQGLSGAPVGATWRINLCREDKPSGENSSWSLVERSFVDNPAEFGRCYFPR